MLCILQPFPALPLTSNMVNSSCFDDAKASIVDSLMTKQMQFIFIPQGENVCVTIMMRFR